MNNIGADNEVSEKYEHIPIGERVREDVETDEVDFTMHVVADDEDAFGF